MKLTLTQKKQETSDVTSFVFEPETPLTWVAGQFLHYTLEHQSPDDRGTERWFTISAAPFEKHVMLTTRFDSQRSSTFKQALFGLNVGDTITADTPEGDFTLENPDQEYVFLAGGIGITPFRAILKDLDQKNLKSKINLLYSNRNQEVVFKEELEQLKQNNPNLTINYLFSPQRIDETTIKQFVPNLTQPIFYLSGPEPMVEALGETLKKLGVAQDHIKQDFFPGYPAE